MHTNIRTIYTCKADRTLEGSTHALKAVLNQVALKLCWWVERLTTELAFMVQSFLCREETTKTHKIIREKISRPWSLFLFLYFLLYSFILNLNSTNLWQRLLPAIFMTQTGNNITCDLLPSGINWMTSRGSNRSDEALHFEHGEQLPYMQNNLF